MLIQELLKKKILEKSRATTLEYEVKTSGKKEEEVILEQKIVSETFLFGLKSEIVKVPLKTVSADDIILEVLDARFPEQTRNLDLEQDIEQQNKKIIYVLNKSDLVNSQKLNKFYYLNPNIAISCTKRQKIKDLRNLIKRIAKTIEKIEKRTLKKDKIIESDEKRIKVGVIGYPNTGKSSILNLLAGKKAAGVGSEAGFTKGVQKIRLTENIVLLDTPGIIPGDQYSTIKKDKIAEHTIFGGKSYTQVKEPELVVHQIMQEFPDLLQKHYKIKTKSPEHLIEKLGRIKGILKKGNQVNEDKTARFILKEWQLGEIKV